jgi:hypothetical protein
MSYPPPYPPFGQGPEGPYGQQGPEGPYGQQGPQYGYPPPGWRVEHPRGTTILVLGILSLVICGLIGPFAWSMGNTALREIDANPAYYSNRGQVVAGRICGMVATILLIVGVVVFVLVVAVASTTSS